MPRIPAVPVADGIALRISAEDLVRIHERTSDATEDALPHPNAELTMNHPFSVDALGFGKPQPITLPDSGISPATIGSLAQP